MKHYFNAIFYLLKTGCQWRMLPGCFPKWELVYYDFTKFEIVLRSHHSSQFVVILKRWVVERTFAWFESCRRLSKDFEYLTDTGKAMIQLAMIRLMLNRIQK